MAFIWRRYSPKMNRLSLPRIFNSHGPLDGKLMGICGARRGLLDRTLTKRTVSDPLGWSAK